MGELELEIGDDSWYTLGYGAVEEAKSLSLGDSHYSICSSEMVLCAWVFWVFPCALSILLYITLVYRGLYTP